MTPAEWTANARSTEGFWVAYLSQMMAFSLKEERPKEKDALIRPALSEFLRSPVPGEDLRQALRKEMAR